MAAWRSNILSDPKAIRQVALTAKRIAVVGIKTEKQADQPAFRVPAYMQEAGCEVVPVPVYYPEATTILGQPVFRQVRDVPGPLDIVNIFRRPADVPGHLEDILAKKPRVVWLQSGISNAEAEEAWAKAGIMVVADRCLMVEHRQALAEQQRQQQQQQQQPTSPPKL